MLMRRPTAIDRERGAGDGSRCVTAEKHSERGQFLDGDESFRGLLAEHDLADHLIF